MDILSDFFEKSEEESLIQKLKDYDLAYYIEGNNPLITDKEYDDFKEYVKSLYPDNVYFQEVGSFSEKGEKVKHEFILGSLTKYKIDTIEKWLSKFKNDEYVIITPKYDGLTNYSVLENEELILASTRGNGLVGTNITEKVKVFISKNNNVGTLKIRGETLLPGNLYEKLGFSNRRNSTSGILGRDEYTTDLKFLDVVFYEILECDIPLKTEEERLIHINKIFPNNKLLFEKIKVKDISLEYLKNKLSEFRDKLSSYCDIDGLVLTINDSIRENEKYPKNKVAFKFGDKEEIGEILKVNWETSRNGRVVPVIELKDPIILDGAEILRATAYNAKFVVDNDLREGKKVKIVRSGSVIPKIVGTL